jgi:hypothetical protein
LIASAADAIPVYGEDPSTMTLVLKPFLITELLAVIDRLVSQRCGRSAPPRARPSFGLGSLVGSLRAHGTCGSIRAPIICARAALAIGPLNCIVIVAPTLTPVAPPLGETATSAVTSELGVGLGLRSPGDGSASLLTSDLVGPI